MEKSCRFCHYYVAGKCLGNCFSVSGGRMEDIVRDVAERGELSETITENIEEDRQRHLNFERILETYLTESRLPKKRQKEVYNLLNEAMDKFFLNLVENLDGAVSILYQNELAAVDGVDVKPLNPSETYCNKWA